mmetsp:Transcript_14648/g.22917  ORF Transcript_14648/g.22917 Transcript_14648/m.22917 type:complete len:90 (+) Transcript_14648:94-363(+)
MAHEELFNENKQEFSEKFGSTSNTNTNKASHRHNQSDTSKNDQRHRHKISTTACDAFAYLEKGRGSTGRQSNTDMSMLRCKEQQTHKSA